MRAYTYQVGEGTGDEMTALIHSESIFADSLGEAIDRAKAVTNLRPAHANENTVCLLDEFSPDAKPVWVRSIQDVRTA